MAEIVGIHVKKTRTHEKKCENLHFLKSTVSPLFLTLKKKKFSNAFEESGILKKIDTNNPKF